MCLAVTCFQPPPHLNPSVGYCTMEKSTSRESNPNDRIVACSDDNDSFSQCVFQRRKPRSTAIGTRDVNGVRQDSEVNAVHAVTDFVGLRSARASSRPGTSARRWPTSTAG